MPGVAIQALLAFLPGEPLYCVLGMDIVAQQFSSVQETSIKFLSRAEHCGWCWRWRDKHASSDPKESVGRGDRCEAVHNTMK